ncbi:MAG TPA: YraN family protein [Luteolibacter sp.]|nr:YraN family protein [Luteolibacter sp.]
MTDAAGVERDSRWLGRYGERVAASWLRSKGCRILARGFRGPRRGEVDLIARRGKLLLFVEVKTRQADAAVRPLSAVDARKRSLIERGAHAWLRQLGTRKLPWRFDVIEILVTDGERPVVRWIENAW